jgi:malic enzyme
MYVAHLVTKNSALKGLKDIRSISIAVATAVMRAAVREGNATNASAISHVLHEDQEQLQLYISNCMYDPAYNPLVFVEPGVLE